jgi:hypothetical protein
MKRNKINKSGICRVAALLLVLSALLPAGSLRAQVKINHGVDMSAATGLFAPNNFIYFGYYKHAIELTFEGNETEYHDRGSVTKREGSETPIVWRVMGEEADNRITLLSEYVLDSKIFDANDPVHMWGTSGIHDWLNGTGGTDFPASFTDSEKAVVYFTGNTIHAPVYNDAMIYSSASSSSDTKFYLPWGTPNWGSDLANKNRLFWTNGVTTTLSSLGVADQIPDVVKGIGLKGMDSYPDNNIYYWLRPSVYNLNDLMLYVNSEGMVEVLGPRIELGVRPIFKLDTTNILFAAELMESNSISRVDQMVADNAGKYTDEDALPNGSSGGARKAYKLTLKTSEPTPSINNTLRYDLDETAAAITDTVGFKPGESLGLKANTIVGATHVAYKIVESGTNILMHYGCESIPLDTTIRIVADDIDTEFIGGLQNTDQYKHLINNSIHTAYAWAQYNNDTRSHEGSEPIPFTMKVLDDDIAPVLTPALVPAKRKIDFSAEITFSIREANRDVKYYYVVDGTPLTLFSDFEPLVLASQAHKTKIKLSAATEQITINLPTFGDNIPHAIYIVAKDLVRNVSNVLAITIPIYVPNSPIAVKNPVPELIMEEGDSITIAPGFIVTDADTDDHLTFVPLSVASSDPSIAEATVISGSITVNDSVKVKGVVSGITDVTVQVTDNSWRPEKADTTAVITIPVTVTERMPDAVIDYIEEQLTGLADGWYGFNGEPAVEITDGVYPIADDWFDTDLDIVRVHPGNAVLNSPTQTLTIPARPDAPVLSVVDESYSGWNDGQINSVSSEMEYKADTMAIWTPVAAGYNTVFGLTPGKYQVRYKAAIDRFVSWVSVVTIRMGAPWTAFQRMVSLPDVSGVTSTPSPGIHYTASSTSFAFSLKFGGAPRSVTTSRVVEGVPEVLTGVANAAGGYDYVILRLQQPVAVYIGDAIQANASIEAERTIWSHAGRIYVEASKDDTATIYALTGQLLKQVDVQEGTTGITIGRGVYVVVLKNGAKQKVIVH